jgi:hypothetical protein
MSITNLLPAGAAVTVPGITIKPDGNNMPNSTDQAATTTADTSTAPVGTLVGLTTPAAPTSGFKDRTPSNWEIKPVPETDDQITAFNIKSFENFEGTIETFNQNLRG